MDLISQIEGVQDIILRKLPSSHLPRMHSLSREWVEPSHSLFLIRLDSHIQDFKTRIGFIPTTRSEILDPAPGNQKGYAWCRARWSEYAQVYLGRTGRPPIPPPNSTPEVIKILRNIFFINTRASYDRVNQQRQHFLNLSEKRHLYRGDKNSKQWIHPIYSCADWLINERFWIEIQRQELNTFLRIALPKQCHQYYIKNFAKATRPDLMVQRLKDLTYRLQKT